jgi:uncharacterized protein Usg
MRLESPPQILLPVGTCLATIEIIYRMPDHPVLLQTFVWQHWDTAPQFPALKRFLEYWELNLDGPIHSVRVAQSIPQERARLRHTRHLRSLH